MLAEGIKGEMAVTVDSSNTAKQMGSGALEVFATPALVTLMEGAAMRSVQPHLDAGQGTVGAAIDLRHTAPSPMGAQVRCESTLISIDGRRLRFEIHAFDEAGPVGSAMHERFIINSERFLKKAQERRQR